MNDKEYEELKTNYENSYDAVKTAEEDFQVAILNHSAISLPEGFEFDIDVRYKARLSGNNENEVSIRVADRNFDPSKEGNRPKYFWTMDGKTNLVFQDNKLLDMASSSLQGGFNSHEYGNKEGKKTNLIELHEKTLEINTAYLNLLKIAEATPEFFLKPLQEYNQAYTLCKDYRDSLDKENKVRKAQERTQDLELIFSAFDKLGSKSVDKLANKLKHTDQSEVSLSVVVLEDCEHESTGNVVAKEIKVTCKHGAKMSYSVKEGNMVASRIAGADVSSYLKEGIIVNGKRPETVQEFQEMFEGDFSAEKKENTREVRLNIKEAANLSKRLIEHSKLKNPKSRATSNLKNRNV